MAQDYYNLDKAAEVLGIPPAELNEMREQGKVRAYRDGARWLFKKEQIDDLARQLKRKVPATIPGPAANRGGPASENVCFYCAAKRDSAAVFCRRCGGELQPKSHRQRLLDRLQRIRQLIRGRGWVGFRGGYSIRQQVAAAKDLLEQHPELAAECRQSFDWLAADLAALDDVGDLPARIKITQLCLGLFASDDCKALRDRIKVLQQFVNELLSGEKVFEKGRPPTPEKFQAWLEFIANQASLGLEDATRHIAATPQHWWEVAAAVHPERAAERDVLLALAQGEAALREKNFGTAGKQFAKVLAQDDSNVRALEGMGRMHVSLREHEEAIPYYRMAVARGTPNATSYNNLAWYLCTERKKPMTEQEAEEAFSAAWRAVELAPVACFLDTLAEVLCRLGDPPGAIAATREAIRDDPHRTAYHERMESLVRALPSRESMEGGSFGELDLTIEEDLQLEDDDLVLGGDDSGITIGQDSEISLVDPQDSGLLLDEPLELPSDDESLALGEDDMLTLSEEADTELPTQLRADDDFLLTPLEEGADDEDSESGSQPIALDEAAGDEAATMVAEGAGAGVAMLGEEDMGMAGVSPLAPSMTEEPAAPAPTAAAVTDRVQFSVTSPTMIAPGNFYVIDVWAHLAEQREEMLALARESQLAEKIQVKSKMGVKVARGAVLSVQLSIRGLVVEEGEDVMVWEGDLVNAAFGVEVPAEAKAGRYPGTAIIRAETIRLARIPFVITVAREELRQPQQSEPARPYRSAFASYASRDRDEVLGRLQGIQKVLPGLDLFLDVASLRSGDRWEDRLRDEIVGRDVFYLFWSQAASESSYVTWEWETALEHKGIECIDPIPLVSPDVVPPPQKLAAHLHFNDWTLAYMRGAKQ